MADLQSCFFCGTPEELKQYAVVPPRFTDDGNPQTAVLCPQCKAKLLQVIEPLVDRLEGDEVDPATPQQGSEQQGSPASGADGITMSPQGGTESTGNEPASANTAGSTRGTGNESDASTSDAASEVTAGGPEAPPNYRRAMRMLETREFPLQRTEVESLLANAYDMETHELEAVFDHAVETGDLVEEDGQFRKPE